ncbi:hypothetical protein SAMN05216223_12995 [Actinacidiphila yanglinensis]|uniref:Alpha/beta hydrolase family protein n=1 Tax=Actinacidiphila yanglinensis TaxID=310779 RepID=A0A1H6E924_9ACTN|nr:hypothetical protein [Actinacidiphila yanglinensis]SEG94250.1 hypothetical protein SAMN05216223_12995 [Actinacidiphila yanglinensis]
MPTSDDAVLVVEFTGLASEMSFEAAFPSGSGTPVIRVDPLVGVAGDGPVDVAAHARAVAHGHAGGGPYRAVVANCNGAPFAVHLAAALAAEGVPPGAVVLVDPLAVTGEDLSGTVADLLAGLGAATEVPTGLFGAGEPGRLFAAATVFLRAAVAERLGDVLEEDEDPGLVADSLVGRYATWIALLTGNLGARRPALGIPVQVLHTHGRDDLGFVVDARAGVTRLPVSEGVRDADAPLAHPGTVEVLRRAVGGH